jgi:hypothetical protein
MFSEAGTYIQVPSSLLVAKTSKDSLSLTRLVPFFFFDNSFTGHEALSDPQ